MNTPVAAFFKTVGGAAFGYMLPILAAFIAMSIADRPGLAVGFAGGVLAMNGTNFAGIANGETTGISGGFLAAMLAGFLAGYIVQFLKKITEKLPASLNGLRPMLIYPLGGMLIIGAVMCGINPVMGMINTAMTNWLNALGGTSKVLLGAIVAGMMSIDMGGPFNKAAYVFGTAALASGNYEVMAGRHGGRMVPPIASPCHHHLLTQELDPDERRNGIVELRHGSVLRHRGCHPLCSSRPAARSAQLHHRFGPGRFPVHGLWLRPAGTPRRHLRVPRGGPRRSVLRGAGCGQRGGCCDPEPAQEGPHRRLIRHLLPPLETSSYSTRPPGSRGPCVVSVALFTQKRLPGVENRSSRFAWMKSYLPCFTRWISPRS